MSDYLMSISIECIAAFLGFLSALILDDILEKRTNVKKINLLSENLCEELEDIDTALTDMLKHNSNLSYTIQTPSWDAMQNAGLTIGLIEKPFYNDLIFCYSLIKTSNEMLLFHKNKTIDTLALTEIHLSISNLLNKIKENKYGSKNSIIQILAKFK